jgi:hypothetical protein
MKYAVAIGAYGNEIIDRGAPSRVAGRQGPLVMRIRNAVTELAVSIF